MSWIVAEDRTLWMRVNRSYADLVLPRPVEPMFYWDDRGLPISDNFETDYFKAVRWRHGNGCVETVFVPPYSGDELRCTMTCCQPS